MNLNVDDKQRTALTAGVGIAAAGAGALGGVAASAKTTHGKELLGNVKTAAKDLRVDVFQKVSKDEAVKLDKFLDENNTVKKATEKANAASKAFDEAYTAAANEVLKEVNLEGDELKALVGSAEMSDYLEALTKGESTDELFADLKTAAGTENIKAPSEATVKKLKKQAKASVDKKAALCDTQSAVISKQVLKGEKADDSIKDVIKAYTSKVGDTAGQALKNAKKAVKGHKAKFAAAGAVLLGAAGAAVTYFVTKNKAPKADAPKEAPKTEEAPKS